MTMGMIERIRDAIRSRRLSVTLDPGDSSVTLSKELVRHMGVMSGSEAKVIVTRTSHPTYGSVYCFVMNPDLTGHGETQLSDIQYNGKYRTVGFESLCPTVSRIFYDYGIMPHDRPKRLRVRPVRAESGITAYLMLRP